MAKQGIFITFEGGEGAGKTTQISLLKESFKKKGINIFVTREPGGVHEAEAIRSLILDRPDLDWPPMAQVLLLTAARVCHLEKKIHPLLDKGKIVICDRFIESTLVYQGIGQDVPIDKIVNIQINALDKFRPDLTILLDIPPEIGLKRANERSNYRDLMESRPIEFHEKVRYGFLTFAKIPGNRIVVVNANQPAKDVKKDIHDALEKHLGIKL